MNDFTNLEQLIDHLDVATRDDKEVSLGRIVEAVGTRSFGPLLLIPGLIISAPIIGDIPGMPTLMALIVVLVAGQLLFGRKKFWFPQWLLKRSMARGKFAKAMKWMRPPARFIDKLLRPRLIYLTRGPGRILIAIICIVIALAIPPMEFVPFTANGAGAALTAFGLGLIAQDGLLVLLAFIVTVATLGFVGYKLF